jgi:hypothetical protein
MAGRAFGLGLLRTSDTAVETSEAIYVTGDDKAADLLATDCCCENSKCP